MSAPPRTVAALLGLVAAAWCGVDAAPSQTPQSSPPELPSLCSAGSDSASVTGVVRDERSGRRLPGARVAVARSAEADSSELGVRADSAGRYRLCGGDEDALVSLRPRLVEREGTAVTVILPPGGERPLSRDLPVDMGRSGRLTGRVRDAVDGSPVAAATVRLPALGVTGLTSEDGRFSLDRLPAGRYEIRVRHVGHGVHADSVRVRAGRSVRLGLRISRDPVRVAPLEVEVAGTRSLQLEAEGFYDRRQRGHGTYITREQLQEWDLSHLSEALRRVQGFRLSGPPVRRHVHASRDFRAATRSGPCSTQFIVNGQPQSLPNGIDTFLPADVAALELYEAAAQLPTRFNARSASCGAVVIWLRVQRDSAEG